jgi:hypothetical protein
MHNSEYQIVWFNAREADTARKFLTARSSGEDRSPASKTLGRTEHLPTYVTVRCSKTSNEGLGFPSSMEEIQAFFDVLDEMSTLVVICETI